MLYRLVHTQTTEGPILINDIDQGLPIEYLEEERKQDVYVTYNFKELLVNSEGVVSVSEDESLAGYIDLVPSDKVLLSVDRGVIKGLSDQGFINVIEIADGELGAPTISTATFAVNDASGDDDGSVDLTGDNFLSTNPRESTITITDDSDGESVTFTASEVTGGGGTFTDTSISVPESLHGLGTATGDVENVSVTADRQTASSAVSEV